MSNTILNIYKKKSSNLNYKSITTKGSILNSLTLRTKNKIFFRVTHALFSSPPPPPSLFLTFQKKKFHYKYIYIFFPSILTFKFHKPL